MEKRTESAEAAVARVLADRARRLAVRARAPREAEDVPGLAFDVGPERYAVPLDAVLRVERLRAVARLPGGVARLVAVDGRPCALVEVRDLLGAPASPAAEPRRWVIVLGRTTPELAVAADAVDLAALPRPALAGGGPAPRLGSTEDARLVLDGAALLGARGGGA